MMSRVQKGVIAGFSATLAVSLLELINLFVLKWFAPFPNILSNTLGLGANMAAGWIVHFIAGTLVLGPLFGILCPRLPTDLPETKGILFSVGAWVVLMMLIMMTGNPGAFGRNFGTIGWLLITNAVFGIVMGNVYARLVARDKHAHPLVHGHPAH
jgi:hypothetical protein